MKRMDREKVIKGLTELKKYLPSTMWESINDALALLKEQYGKIKTLEDKNAKLMLLVNDALTKLE